jgi:hypothetical protein
MASYKSLLLRLTVRPAGKKSYCSHNAKHIIPKGATRMIVKAPGIATPEKGYCAACGVAMIQQAEQQLVAIRGELCGR